MAAPVYLFTGPEFGERNDEIDRIKSELNKKYGSFDDYLYYASETSVPTVVSMLQTESLFTPATCIVYKAAELIKKKEDIESLGAWVKSVLPSKSGGAAKDSHVLILVSDENSVDSKLEKIIPKENKKIFWEMFDNRKLPWVKDYFKKNGYSVTDDAADLILEMVENNTAALKTEINRFFTLFQKGYNVTASDVESVIADTKGETGYTLFAALTDTSVSSQERFENALTILQKLKLAANNSSSYAAGITATLGGCFKKALFWHELVQSGSPMDEYSLKSNGFTSKKMRTQYQNASALWTHGQTVAIMALIAQTEIQIRSAGRGGLEDNYLAMLLYCIVIKKGGSMQSYSEDWI